VTFTNITGGNDWDQSFAGAGAVDTASQLVKSITDNDWLSASANLAVGVVDLLEFRANPVDALATSAIGWLIEHISFLDAFLDQTAGDPQAVQNAYQVFYQAAKDLDRVAAEQITAFGTGVDTYRQGASPSAQAFEKRVGTRGAELKTLSLRCLGLGEAMNSAALRVATCRGVFRDLLADLAWAIIQEARIALALAPYTSGGSLAALLTHTCALGARLAKDFAAKLGVLAQDLSELAHLLLRLATEVGIALWKNAPPSVAKNVHDSVDLTAADAAEQKVADHDAAERAEQREKEGPPPKLVPPTFPAPLHPIPQPPKKQGPGLEARWTTSGTLDE
jgi:hypothetical protein